MKVLSVALALLIFSATVALFNDLGVFNHKVYEPGYNVNQSQVDDIYEIDQTTPTIDTKEGLTDRVADMFGLGGILRIINVVLNTLKLAVNLGSLFNIYVPGDVGAAFAALFNVITYFIYGWGGVQLWRKVSSKGMD